MHGLRNRAATRAVLLVLWAGSLAAPSLLAGERPTIVLATVGEGSNERMRILDGRVPNEQPGWFVELSRRAADECGADAEFALMPWKRALKMVQQGNVSAAFNSSYKPGRAVYGVYPWRDGSPDESRASKYLAYHAYVSAGSTDSALKDRAELDGRALVAERSASILPFIEKKARTVQESASYLSMLRMVAGGRVDAAIAIQDNVDPILAHNPDLNAAVRKVETPVKKSVGYVMFSKPFYARHEALVECFWSTSAKLRHSEWFETMRSRYGK